MYNFKSFLYQQVILYKLFISNKSCMVKILLVFFPELILNFQRVNIPSYNKMCALFSNKPFCSETLIIALEGYK